MEPELTSRDWSILLYICSNVGYRPEKFTHVFEHETETLRDKVAKGAREFSIRQWLMLLYFSANAKAWNIPKGDFYWIEVKALTKKLMSVGSQ